MLVWFPSIPLVSILPHHLVSAGLVELNTWLNEILTTSWERLVLLYQGKVMVP